MPLHAKIFCLEHPLRSIHIQMNAYFWALAVYSAALIGLGFWAARRVRSASDFLVAGRRFGPGVIFATFLAANIGAASTVGASGIGYRLGLSAWWWVGSAGIGTAILSQTAGPRLWRIAKANSLHTLGDYLELRFNRAVRGIVALVLWFGTLAILAGQIIAIAWILNVVIGFPKWAGCVAGGSVAILYCVAGGLASTAIVNILELAVTMSGLTLAAFSAVTHLGGISALFSATASQTQALKPGYTLIVGAGAKQILAYVAILVPSFICSPGLVQKLYGARDERAVRIGIALNSAGQLVFAFVPALFGMIAVVALPALTNPELALPSVMTHVVPRWIGLWALAAVFSAELSATDAILFMLSSSLAIDLYKSFLNPSAAQQKLLRVGRIATVAAGAAGIALAVALPSVISAVTIFYGLLAVGLFVPLIFGLYWKRMTTGAALVSIVGAIAADLAVFTFTRGGGIGLLSPHAFGILVAVVLASAMSILGPRRHKVAASAESRAASGSSAAPR